MKMYLLQLCKLEKENHKHRTTTNYNFAFFCILFRLSYAILAGFFCCCRALACMVLLTIRDDCLQRVECQHLYQQYQLLHIYSIYSKLGLATTDLYSSLAVKVIMDNLRHEYRGIYQRHVKPNYQSGAALRLQLAN